MQSILSNQALQQTKIKMHQTLSLDIRYNEYRSFKLPNHEQFYLISYKDV